VEPLSEIEVRVLGTLIEKQFVTPEHYPLTENAVRLGANQKSNRNPVMNLSEAEVREALDSLQRRRLCGMFREPGARAPKYRQFLDREYRLAPVATALLGLLMLRGPQTLGELRARAESMGQRFASLQEVETVLRGLMEHAPHPLVVRLERRPGEREARYAHLLAGPPSFPAPLEAKSELEIRLEALEAEVRELRSLVEAIRRSG
jgi:uncharacterized protein YceH (UPF0502 family)